MMNSEIRSKGSLCSGTAALDRATPGELRWVAETAEAPAALLKREHPHVPNIGDFTRPDSYDQYAHPIDLLTSGDPCQSMSAAGRQLASDDERFLWPDVMNVIRTVRPREIFLENVQNIVSVALVKGGERGGVLKLRLDDLREAGYDVRWTVLGACAVGAPHHRHRWFLRARYVGAGASEAVRLVNKCGASRTGGRVLLPSPKASDSRGPGTARMAKGKEPWYDLPTYVALLPTPAARDGGSRGTPSQQHALRRVANPERSINLEDAVVAYLLPTPRATDIGTPGRRSSEGWRPQLGQAVLEQWGKYAEAVALWEQIIGRPAPEPTEPAPKGGRRLNPALSEWMMGYPEGYLTKDASRNEALKMAGNGVVELQARAAWEMLEWPS